MRKGQAEQEKKFFNSTSSFPKCLQGLGLGHSKTSSPELCPDLPSDWQEPRHMEYLLRPSQAH